MTELVNMRDLSAPGSDGWAVLYDIRRTDQEFVFVRVECSERDEAVIESEGDPELVRVARERGRSKALAYAERVEPGRGLAEVRLRLHPASRGGAIATFHYGTPAEVGNPNGDVRSSAA
jgi:hypothetical protein